MYGMLLLCLSLTLTYLQLTWRGMAHSAHFTALFIFTAHEHTHKQETILALFGAHTPMRYSYSHFDGPQSRSSPKNMSETVCQLRRRTGCRCTETRP